MRQCLKTNCFHQQIFVFTYPKAVVRVETGDQPAVYVNQYSVADRLKPLVDEKIREMWERECIGPNMGSIRDEDWTG